MSKYASPEAEATRKIVQVKNNDFLSSLVQGSEVKTIKKKSKKKK